jgi:hypothetical protein
MRGLAKSALMVSMALAASAMADDEQAKYEAGQGPKRLHDDRVRKAAEQAEQVLVGLDGKASDTRPRKVRRAEAAQQRRELKRLRKYMHNVDAIVVKLTELRAGQNITPAEIRREAVYLARLGHTVDTICQEG